MIPKNIEIGRTGSALSVIIRRNRVIASPTNIEIKQIMAVNKLVEEKVLPTNRLLNMKSPKPRSISDPSSVLDFSVENEIAAQ
jgi:hypothetical protein